MRAGRWETRTSMGSSHSYHRMIPYSNKLWVMDSLHGYNLEVDLYDVQQNKWEISKGFVDVIDISREQDKSLFSDFGTIFDAVIFDVLTSLHNLFNSCIPCNLNTYLRC